LRPHSGKGLLLFIATCLGFLASVKVEMEIAIGTILSISQLKQKYGIEYHCTGNMIYSACTQCGDARWVRMNDQGRKCQKCRGKSQRKWNNNNPDITIVSNEEYKKMFPMSKSKTPQVQYKCAECGTIKWIGWRSYKDNQICNKCNAVKRRLTKKNGVGKNNVRWNPACRFLDSNGYVMVRIDPSNLCYPMIKNYGGRKDMIREHRLVMAQSLGRCLTEDEIVHHVNGCRNDNRIENLELVSCAQEHIRYKHIHVTTRVYIKKLEKEINTLREELILLKNQ